MIALGRHDADAAAIAAFPELAALVQIRDAGWAFLPPVTVNGAITEIDGLRTWPTGWFDAIRIRSASDVLGIRTDCGDPPGIVWERTGGLVEIIDALIELPPPDARTAPRRVIGAAPRLVIVPGPRLWTPGGSR